MKSIQNWGRMAIDKPSPEMAEQVYKTLLFSRFINICAFLTAGSSGGYSIKSLQDFIEYKFSFQMHRFGNNISKSIAFFKANLFINK